MLQKALKLEITEHNTDLPSTLYVIFSGLKIYNLSSQIYIVMNNFLKDFN